MRENLPLVAAGVGGAGAVVQENVPPVVASVAGTGTAGKGGSAKARGGGGLLKRLANRDKGGRAVRAKERVREKSEAATQQELAADAAAALKKLRRAHTVRNLEELDVAVQQGEALQECLPELAAAMPAAMVTLAELKAQETEQLKLQVVALAEQALGPGESNVEMSGYFSELFVEGDKNHDAQLDFNEFAGIMERIAPNFEGVELRAAFLAAGVAPPPHPVRE